MRSRAPRWDRWVPNLGGMNAGASSAAEFLAHFANDVPWAHIDNRGATMYADLRSMLNETEKGLLRAVEPKRLQKLDEDELSELHDRIRRARNKYSKLYRRRAGAKVKSDRSRGSASAANAKASLKAEGFEDALARVSDRLSKVAAAAAEELKNERLAAARRKPVASSGSKSSKQQGKGSAAQASKTSRTTSSKKQRASTKSKNKQQQAKRDRRS